MKKVVINSEHGGFSLSNEAIRLYGKKAGLKLVEDGPDKYGYIHFYVDYVNDGNYFLEHDLERDDPHLVSVVEELGSKANGKYASLKIVEIPDDVEFDVPEYDGMEWVAEKHRTWY